MRALVIVFCTLFSLEAFSVERITWLWIDQKEAELSKWIETVGSENLVALGKMKQQPIQLHQIEAFFPYLLPEGYFARSSKMSCLSDFEAFRKNKNEASKNQWKQCLQGLYRKNMPLWQAQALKDL